jgi:hypothetical protein
MTALLALVWLAVLAGAVVTTVGTLGLLIFLRVVDKRAARAHGSRCTEPVLRDDARGRLMAT